MGHSMGAVTAVNIAIEYPNLPRAIILEDPAWFDSQAQSSTDDKEAKKQQESFKQYLIGMRRCSLEENIAACRKENPRWSEAEIKPWAQSKLQFDPSLFSRLILDETSYIDLVPKINCPALLIIGENGIVTARVAADATKLWHSKQPFKWVRINGAGHNIRREQFAEFRQTLFNFLKTLPADY